MITRRYLVAPALARLIRRQRGSTTVIEGFFEQQPSRKVHLRISGNDAHLVLAIPRHDGDPEEQATEIPAQHAVALLASCAGKISFEQSGLALADGQEVLVRRFDGLNAFALASVTFADSDAADRFVMPVWFGSEVTDDDDYANRGLALRGIPRLGELSVADAALDAVLDLLDALPEATAERPAAKAGRTAASEADLPQETISALTERVAHAIADTADGAEAGSDEPQTSAAPVSPLRRSDSGPGGLRGGFRMTRAGFNRDDQPQDVAVGS